MSCCVHGDGSTAGAAVTVTLSIVAVAVRVLSWLDTGMPTSTFCGSVTVTVPMAVHAAPSDEYDAATLLPARTSRTNLGGTPATAVLLLTPPLALRHCIAIPLPGVTNTDACGEPASVVARIMTPALVHTLTFCTLATRATMVPSPDSGW